MNRDQLPLTYPPTNRIDQTDDYHGTSIDDPYRWLEDPDSPQTRSWIEAQNRLTFGFLETIPSREPLRRRLTELWDYERFGIPWHRGAATFYTHNDGLQNQNVLYTIDSAEAQGSERVPKKHTMHTHSNPIDTLLILVIGFMIISPVLFCPRAPRSVGTLFPQQNSVRSVADPRRSGHTIVRAPDSYFKCDTSRADWPRPEAALCKQPLLSRLCRYT